MVLELSVSPTLQCAMDLATMTGQREGICSSSAEIGPDLRPIH
jgi:hypothetical protein